MRKTLIFLLSSCVLCANSLQMPPSIPSITQKTQAKNNPCDMIPPMLQMMPPPLQEAVDRCQTESNIPKKEKVLSFLKDKKINYETVTIKPMDGFVKLYMIDLGNATKIYCNEKMQCFEPKRVK